MSEPDNDTVVETRLVKHSLVVAGHRTSISLEGIFWHSLKQLAETRSISVAALVREVDAARGGANLSSALRVYVLRNREALPSRPRTGDHPG